MIETQFSLAPNPNKLNDLGIPQISLEMFDKEFIRFLAWQRLQQINQQIQMSTFQLINVLFSFSFYALIFFLA